MVDLSRAAAELVQHPVAPPTPLAAIERRASALRRRRRRIVAGVASLPAAAAVAAVVVVLASRGSIDRVAVLPPSVPTTATPTPTTSVPVVVPAGWQPVDYNQARIYVPSDWTVIGYGIGVPCDVANKVVILDDPRDFETPCSASTLAGSAGRSFVQLDATQPPLAKSLPLTVNGFEVDRGLYPEPAVNYYVPDLGVALKLVGPESQSILDTISYSPLHQVLAPGPSPAVPASWRRVTYGGVTFDVPPTWPVVHLDTPTPSCDGQTFHYAEVALGAGVSAPTCPPPLDGPIPTDGIWAYVPSPVGIGPGPAQTLLVNGRRIGVRPDSADDTVELAIAVPEQSVPTDLILGLGPDSAVARTIMYSVRVP